MESKAGFVPGGDQVAWRVRRLYRLLKGGHPSMGLLHYSRGPVAQIPPQYMNQPVRSYPLRESGEPPIFVVGENIGKKVYPGPPPSATNSILQGQMAGHGQQAQLAAVALQNAAMGQQMDRRRDRRDVVVRIVVGVPPSNGC